MKVSPSRSVLGRALEPSERRTITGAVIVSAAALLIVYAGLPLVRRWTDRESRIAAAEARIVRLRAVAGSEGSLRTALEARREAIASWPQRLLAARTPALAASALQTLIQEYADRSRVTVSRLDVAGSPDSASRSAAAIPATVSALGDIYGMTELLSLLQHGPRLLDVREMSLAPNSALKGEPLQLTVTLRAPYTTE
jgi:hypothetical protein